MLIKQGYKNNIALYYAEIIAVSKNKRVHQSHFKQEVTLETFLTCIFHNEWGQRIRNKKIIFI